MTIADSSRSSLAYVEEPGGGLVGGETFRLLRNTGNSLNGSISASPTDEIRADRQISGSSHTSASLAGDINIQLSYGEYDDFLEAVLESSGWSAYADSASAAVVTTNIFSGIGATTGLVPEQVVKITGGTLNPDGLYTIKTIEDANSISVHETLVSETIAYTLTSSMISNETTTRNFAVESAFQDVTEFFLSEGLKVGSMKFALSNSQSNGSFSFMGTNYTASGVSVSAGGVAGYNDSLTNDVLNGASGIGGISIQRLDPTGVHDAASAAIFESLDITLDNSLREQSGLGSLYPIGVGRGRFSADISANMYFESRALFERFIANDVMTIRFSVTDDENDIVTGNSYHFSFPGCRIQSYEANPESADTDVMAKISFKAVIDPYLTQKTCIVTRIPV